MLTTAGRDGRRSIGIIVSAVAAVACSGTSATGPTATRNAQLIAHFDSLSKTSMAIHADQLRAAIGRLADGAPVGRAQVVVDGKASTYSIIAEYDVDDSARVPVDSLLTIFAWSGEDADTIIELDVGNGVSILLTDAVDLFVNDTVLAPTGLTTSAPAGACATVDVTVPPGSSMVKGDDCRRETLTLPISESLSASAESSLHFELPAQAIAAIRQEFYDAFR